MFRILLLGPQGSGKGTQAELLSKKLGLPLIIAGDLLRREIAQETEFGKWYKPRYELGEFAPNQDITRLIEQRIKEPDAERGFIIDSYPRDLRQKELSEKFITFTHVVVFQLADEEAVKRLGGRRMCSQCGRNYHLESNPPIQTGVCDGDGTKLIVRSDDTPEAIKKRLEIYHAETKPLVELYRSKGVLYEIDAATSINEIHQRIMKALKAA